MVEALIRGPIPDGLNTMTAIDTAESPNATYAILVPINLRELLRDCFVCDSLRHQWDEPWKPTNRKAKIRQNQLRRQHAKRMRELANGQYV